MGVLALGVRARACVNEHNYETLNFFNAAWWVEVKFVHAGELLCCVYASEGVGAALMVFE